MKTCMDFVPTRGSVKKMAQDVGMVWVCRGVVPV